MHVERFDNIPLSIAKRLMQLLWISGLAWDDPLLPELTLKWKSFK